MKYSFLYKVSPCNLLILSMVNIYKSMLSIINLVFTVSMILLAVKFWPTVNPYLRVLIMFGILLFPVLQPLLIYLRSRRIVRKMPEDMVIGFDSDGITISSEMRKSEISYGSLKFINRVAGMIIIYTKDGQGYILGKDILGDNGKRLYEYLLQQLK